MTQFVLVNGPPRSGKDTLVSGLVEYIDFNHEKFALPIKMAIAGFLNCTLSELEAIKDTPLPEFGGATPRDLMIKFSDDLIRAHYGEEIFGKMLWLRAKDNGRKLNIVSDCGKVDEVERLVRSAGKGNCIIIRVSRKGTTFEKDSRQWLPDGICRTYNIWNDTTRHQLTMFGLRIIMRHFDMKLLREPDWVKT